MIKRILGGAAAAALAATLLTPGSASAVPCTSETAPNGGAPVVASSPTGTTVYGAGGAGGGYVGVYGGSGWLQVAGSPTSGATVSGNSTPEAVEGTVTVGSTPNVCINGTDRV